MEMSERTSAVIEEAKLFAEDFFKGDFSGHDYYHTLRVYRLAMTIAKGEKCDGEIVALGALLHDVDDYKLVSGQKEPYENAKGFLRKHGYDEKTVSRIIHVIEQVSFKGSDSAKPDTIEGMIVQDADRLDAIGAIGIARTFAYGGKHGRTLDSSIEHFHEKLLLLKDMMHTEKAKELAESRHAFMEKFLQEWENEQMNRR